MKLWGFQYIFITQICAKFQLYTLSKTQIMGHCLRPPTIKILKISTNSVQNVKCHNFRLRHAFDFKFGTSIFSGFCPDFQFSEVKNLGNRENYEKTGDMLYLYPLAAFYRKQNKKIP